MERPNLEDMIDLHDVYAEWKNSGEELVTLQSDRHYYSLTGSFDLPYGISMNTNEANIWLIDDNAIKGLLPPLKKILGINFPITCEMSKDELHRCTILNGERVDLLIEDASN